MELRNIRTFIQVAKLNNFSRAAAELGYAQSTVTTQIKQLEEELGIPLFERNGKRATLSEAGRMFLEHAYRISKSEEEARAFFSEEKEPEGELRIGIMESLCASDYAKFIYEFQKKYPGVCLKLYVCTTIKAMELLEKGMLDVIVTLDRRIERPHWITSTEIEEKISFFCAVDHPFARREMVTLEELIEEKFLMIESGCNYRQVFEQDLEERGESIACRMEIGHTSMIIDAVAEGLGISLLPNFTLKTAFMQGKVAAIPVKDYEIKMLVQVICDKNRWVSKPLSAFLDSMACYKSRMDREEESDRE